MRIYGKPGEYFVREDIAPVAASLTAGVPDRRKIACDTAAKFYGLG